MLYEYEQARLLSGCCCLARKLSGPSPALNRWAQCRGFLCLGLSLFQTDLLGVGKGAGGDTSRSNDFISSTFSLFSHN